MLSFIVNLSPEERAGLIGGFVAVLMALAAIIKSMAKEREPHADNDAAALSVLNAISADIRAGNEMQRKILESVERNRSEQRAAEQEQRAADRDTRDRLVDLAATIRAHR